MEAPQGSAEQRFGWKIELMNMFHNGVIFTVQTPEEARVAEDAGARGVIPVDASSDAQKKKQGAPLTTDINTIEEVMDRVVIPVIGRVRVGHVMEAKAMEEAKVTCIDEHEILNPIMDKYTQKYARYFKFKDGPAGADGDINEISKSYIHKTPFRVPFICGAADLGEALKQIQAGASMIRTKIAVTDEAHEIVKTFDCVRKIVDEIERISTEDDTKLQERATQYDVDIALVRWVSQLKKLPVPFFAAGGILMPIDAAMLMSMGCNGVIVSIRIFKVRSPETRARDFVTAVKNFKNPAILARISERTGGLGPKP